MLRRLLALTTSLAMIAPAPALAQSSPAAGLEQGIRETREGDYEAAVTTLQGVIKQLGAPGAARELARAYTYLGVAHQGLGQDAAAKADFQAALKADPKLVLAASEFPPRVIQAFAAARAATGLPAATGPAIEHSPLKCLEQDLFPEVRAAVQSPAAVQKSRVYFKAHQYPDWYYVEMAGEKVPNYLGMLPKPLPGTQKVDYYVYALDSQLQTSQTTEYDPDVSKTCKRDGAGAVAVPQAEPRITLFGTTEGQAPIPPGFDEKGVIAFVTVAGAMIAGAALSGGAAAAGTAGGAAAGGAAAGSSGSAGAGAAGGAGAAAGGGLSAATIGLIAGGVAVAGIGVAAAGGGGGGEDPAATDNDGDGLSETAGDCNDANPQVNPSGTINFTNARFPNPSINCPEGNNGPINLEISLDSVNNRCSAATITSAQVTFRVEAVRNTEDSVGETFSPRNPTVTPTSLPSAASTMVRVVSAATCTNPRGGRGGFTELSATVVLATSAGNFTLQTTNRQRVNFP